MQIVKKSQVSALVVCATLAVAQSPGKKTPAVIVAPVDLVSVTRGKGGPVTIHFRVPPGYHGAIQKYFDNLPEKKP